MGLVQGSPLTISRHNSTSLLISMDKNLGRSAMRAENDTGTLFISRPEAPETILKKIVCLYIQGYNMIKVRLSEAPGSSYRKTTIRELVRRQLIGVEIVSDTSDCLVLQILLGKSELTIDNAMKRMSIVSSAMLEDAIAALKVLDKKRARDVVEKDEIERFGSYTSRQILGSINHDFFNEGDDSEPEKLAIYLMISRAIENVSKCGREIADQALKLDLPLELKVAEEIGRIGIAASEIFDSAILAFFKRDSRAAEVTIEKSKEFSSMLGSMIENTRRMSVTSPSLAAQVVALIGSLESMKMIVYHSIEVADLVLSLTPEQYVRSEEPVPAFSSSGLILERDQINVFS